MLFIREGIVGLCPLGWGMSANIVEAVSRPHLWQGFFPPLWPLSTPVASLHLCGNFASRLPQGITILVAGL